MTLPDPAVPKQANPRRSELLAGAETAMHRAARRAQLRAREIAVRTHGFKESERSRTTHVAVTIRNPAAPNRAWEARFLVDPTATDSVVPGPRLEAIGLEPKSRRMYELSDGREMTVATATAEIEFLGEIVGGTVLFGEAGMEPVLGAAALASAGIEIDPTTKTLKRLPAVRLKTQGESERRVRRGLDNERRRDDIEAALGGLPDTGHEWDDDPAAWVRGQRLADPRRSG